MGRSAKGGHPDANSHNWLYLNYLIQRPDRRFSLKFLTFWSDPDGTLMH
jgi:hypothetical protein